MLKQDQKVFEKFEFLESVMNRYKNSSYNQIRPILENPQTLFEFFNEKPLRIFLHAHQIKQDEIYVLLSELIEYGEDDICTWFYVGFKKLQSDENVEITFNKTAYCPFCNEVSKFNTDMPIERYDIYHCMKCRNFFESTSIVLKALGLILSSVFSLISIFIIFVGGLMFIDSIVLGHFFSLFIVVSMFIVFGGALTLMFLVKKIWLAFKDPMLSRVSDFGMYFENHEI